MSHIESTSSSTSKSSSKKNKGHKRESDPAVRLSENVANLDRLHTRVVSDKKRSSVVYPEVNGKPNPKYVDVQTEYPVIPGQEYGLYSFISPENVIRRREFHHFERFVRQWNFASSVSMYAGFMQFLSHKHKLNIDLLQADLKEFVVSEAEELRRFNITDDFSHFMETNFAALEKEYRAAYGFETSVRGFVNHGAFGTLAEAKAQANKLQLQHPEFTISICQNFRWVPSDPDMYRVKDVSYLNPELNQLMMEKLENEKKAKDEFDRRIYEAKRAAVQANLANARANGTQVSQVIDDDGNLVNTRNVELDMDNRDPAPVRDETK